MGLCVVILSTGQVIGPFNGEDEAYAWVRRQPWYRDGDGVSAYDIEPLVAQDAPTSAELAVDVLMATGATQMPEGGPAEMARALYVFLADPRIRFWLEANDPKALEQARAALRCAIGAYCPSILSGHPADPADSRGVTVGDNEVAEVSHMRQLAIAADIRTALARHCPSVPEAEAIACANNLAVTWGLLGMRG